MQFSMRSAENPLVQKLRDGKVVIGTWINTLRDPLIARIVAWAGFDYVFIDMEHSAISESALLDMCLIARECGITPIVRPTNPYNYQQNGRLLDIGAAGMIIPHVDDGEQARKIVASTKFFDGGFRGYCGKTVNSGLERNTEEFLKRADANTVLVAQFEDAESISRADEILSIPGIGMAIVGRGDLAHTMGLSGKGSDPRVGEQVEKVITACGRNNVAPGLLVNSVDEAREWIARGVRCVTYSSELGILQDGYRNALTALRG